MNDLLYHTTESYIDDNGDEIEILKYHYDNAILYHKKNGSRCWHRIDGPAYIAGNGDKTYCINGLLHRKDGPARDFVSGQKEWWVEGEYIDCKSQEEFERILKLKLFW